MRPTLRINSRGEDVTNLQARLNQLPTLLPRLPADGIFGPKTLARVLEFQRDKSLTVDGIFGDESWNALDPPPDPSTEATPSCGNGDFGNMAAALRIQQMFRDSYAQYRRASQIRSASHSQSMDAARAGSILPSVSFRPFVGSGLDTPQVTRVFGQSIDFTSVYISNHAGIDDRPFTAGFLYGFVPGLGNAGTPSVQVMNLGSSRDTDTVIHELTHVWQSQHHTDPMAFMFNCVNCQKLAVAQNVVAAGLDPRLLLHRSFRYGCYPNSAYAFRRGRAFGLYGGEQIAQQVENNVPAIRSHIVAALPRTVDSGNVSSLNLNVATEDVRLPGVDR